MVEVQRDGMWTMHHAHVEGWRVDRIACRHTVDAY